MASIGVDLLETYSSHSITNLPSSRSPMAGKTESDLESVTYDLERDGCQTQSTYCGVPRSQHLNGCVMANARGVVVEELDSAADCVDMVALWT